MNYEKVYKKLKATIDSERKMAIRMKCQCDCEKLRNEGYMDGLRWFLVECIPEIEGKKHRNIFFNKEEFKDWKKEIKK